MTVNGVGSYGTFAVSGSSGRNVKSGQSVRFNFQAAGEKADNLLAGMKELDTGKRSSDRSILEDSGCFDSSYWSENMKKAAETADSEQSVTDLREEYARLLKEKSEEIFTKIKNGETENSYQIGSQSFTEKEWDEFLSKFDSLEDAIRKLMEEEQEKERQKSWERRRKHLWKKHPWKKYPWKKGSRRKVICSRQIPHPVHILPISRIKRISAISPGIPRRVFSAGKRDRQKAMSGLFLLRTGNSMKRSCH